MVHSVCLHVFSPEFLPTAKNMKQQDKFFKTYLKGTVKYAMYVKRISLTLIATYAQRLNLFRRKTDLPSTHRKVHRTGTRVARDAGAKTPNGLQVIEQFGL